jgi:hypothetical protein
MNIYTYISKYIYIYIYVGVIGLSSENFSLSGTKKYLLDFMHENGLEMKGSNERNGDRDEKVSFIFLNLFHI